MSSHTVCRLIDLAAGTGAGREKDILLTGPCRRFQNSPELSAIERGLFRSGTGIRENVQGDSLILYEAENPIREIQFVCAERCV